MKITTRKMRTMTPLLHRLKYQQVGRKRFTSNYPPHYRDTFIKKQHKITFG